MKMKEHNKCDFCGKELKNKFVEGKEAFARFCTKEHARLYNQGKIYKPKERKFKIPKR